MAFRDGCDVVGLVLSDGSVSGVQVRSRDTGEPETLPADLVVDASGRGSRTPEWLERLGYGRPAQTRIDSGLGYSSQRFRLPAGTARGWKTVLLMPEIPRTSRGGVLYPIEGDRWMATPAGIAGDAGPAAHVR